LITLDDCNKDLLLTSGAGYKQTEVKAIMVIKAPRGTMVLFESKPPHWWKVEDAQCEAIKAFMEQHSYG